MTEKSIDRDKLRQAMRKMDDDMIYFLLDDAIDLLTDSKLAKLVGNYIDLENLGPDGDERSPLDDVKAFHKVSLEGGYYEEIDVHSKNFIQNSRGTQAWIADCKRLLDRLVAMSLKNGSPDIAAAFDLIFELLERIDEGNDDIVFFADVGGSRQVYVNWEKVFPGYFKSLTLAAEPGYYAERVVELVDLYQKRDREKYLATARRVATAAQKKALRGA